MNKRPIAQRAFDRSLMFLAGIIALLGWGAWQTGAWARAETEEARLLCLKADQLAKTAERAEKLLTEQDATMPALRRFLQAWAPHLQPQASEQELAVMLRSSLENAAQRKLGLVTDHAITPETAQLQIQSRTVPVQRVTLRASGESLVALITWLGEAESRFPLARIEHWEVAATGGKNTALKLTLAQPLPEPLLHEREHRKEKKSK